MSDLNVSLVLRLIDRITAPAKTASNEFSTAWRKATHAIALASKGMERFQEQAKAKFDLAQSINQASENVRRFAGAASAMVRGPVEDAQQFQLALARLGIEAGMSGASLEQLRAAAVEMGTDGEFTTTQITQAMAVLGRQTRDAGQVIGQMPAVSSFASANMLELGDAARLTTGMLKAYGKGASDTGAVTDILSRAAMLSGQSVAELGQGLVTIGPAARAMGVSLEAAASVAWLLGKAGLDGERGASALNAIMTQLAAPKSIKRSQQVLKMIGVDAFDAQRNLKDLPSLLAEISSKTAGMGNVTKQRAFGALFGRGAADDVAALFEAASPDAIGKFVEQMKTARGATADIDEIMGATADQSSANLSAAWKSLGSILGLSLLPALTWLRNLVAGGLGAIARFADRHRVLSGAVMGTIAVVAMFATALAGVLTIVGTLASAAGVLKLAQGYQLIAKAITRFALPAVLKLNVAFLANPIVLIVVAIVALVAAVVWLVRHWEVVIGVWERFKKASLGVKIIVGLLALPFLAVLGPVLALAFAVRKLIDNWTPIKTFFIDLWDGVVAAFDKAIGWISSQLDALMGNKAFQYLVVAPAMAAASVARAVGGFVGETASGVGQVLAGGPASSSTGFASVGDMMLGQADLMTGSTPARQEVGGLIRVAFDKNGQPFVREMRSTGGIDLEVAGCLAGVGG